MSPEGEETPPTEVEPKVEEAPVKEAPPKPVLPFPPLYDKYSFEGVEVHDPSLKGHIYLDPIYVPHSEGRLTNHPFSKDKMHLVERLANDLMKGGRMTGKKSRTLKAVREALEDLQKRDPKSNPLQLLVNAIENAAPREMVTRLQFGGISVPRAVDTSPSRRLSVAIRNLSMGALTAAKKPKMTLPTALANEIYLASKADMTSFAIAKKEEIERIAQSAR
jgi:small subunit ribosomal protein S7